MLSVRPGSPAQLCHNPFGYKCQERSAAAEGQKGFYGLTKLPRAAGRRLPTRGAPGSACGMPGCRLSARPSSSARSHPSPCTCAPSGHQGSLPPVLTPESPCPNSRTHSDCPACGHLITAKAGREGPLEPTTAQENRAPQSGSSEKISSAGLHEGNGEASKIIGGPPSWKNLCAPWDLVSSPVTQGVALSEQSLMPKE